MRKFARRLSLVLFLAAFCWPQTACYRHVIKDDRWGSGDEEIYEPNRKPDVIDRLLYGKEDDDKSSR